MVVYSGSNTDCKSSEPLKTLVMLCYVSAPSRNLFRGAQHATNYC